ncbi:MAG: DUF4843 domain-containing protein [Odoribacter sp.]
MKKIKYISNGWIYLILGLLFTACEETNYPTFETTFTGIYFPKDSIRYSFGITPLATTNYTMELPIKIMGVPVNRERTFKVIIVPNKTTAQADVHYKMPTECVIKADSINGILPLEVFRKELGDSLNWQVSFKLQETTDFVPVHSAGDQVVATFNNVVEPPAWKDWQGNPTWPDFKLGPWNPFVWVKFIEYFRQMEQTVPATYRAIVKTCGPNLENVQFGWLWDYDYTMTKYILIPLYNFFQQHPEYGAEIPNPNVAE